MNEEEMSGGDVKRWMMELKIQSHWDTLTFTSGRLKLVLTRPRFVWFKRSVGLTNALGRFKVGFGACDKFELEFSAVGRFGVKIRAAGRYDCRFSLFCPQKGSDTSRWCVVCDLLGFNKLCLRKPDQVPQQWIWVDLLLGPWSPSIVIIVGVRLE